MMHHKMALVALAATLALAACNDEELPGTAGAGGSGGSAGSGGSGGSGDLHLDAPKTPEQGWQYDIPLFEVKAGEEIQDCYFFEVPYDVPVFVNKLTMAQNEGSHHFNIFRVNTVKGLGGKHGDKVAGGECWKSINWSDWPLVMNMQLAGVNEWQLPEGVVHGFKPRELLMVQTHFVNATTQKAPLGGRGIINFERIPDAQVKHEVGTAFATNQGIEICPGEKDKKFETHCKFAKDEPVTIIGANGHFHSRGKKFSMAVWDNINGAASTNFYESKAWDEPPFERSLDVLVPPGGGVSYTCEFTVKPDSCGDPAKNCCFTFGPKVEQNEHCNAFVYYYPKRPDTQVNCF